MQTLTVRHTEVFAPRTSRQLPHDSQGSTYPAGLFSFLLLRHSCPDYRFPISLLQDASMTVGDRIHYSGDMANAQGWFRVTKVETLEGATRTQTNVTMTEEGGEGRVITIPASNVGNVYAGHCNPRFVTEKAVMDFRRAQTALMVRGMLG